MVTTDNQFGFKKVLGLLGTVSQSGPYVGLILLTVTLKVAVLLILVPLICQKHLIKLTTMLFFLNLSNVVYLTNS